MKRIKRLKQAATEETKESLPPWSLQLAMRCGLWGFAVESGAARRGMSRIKSPAVFCTDSTTYKPNYIFRGIFISRFS